MNPSALRVAAEGMRATQSSRALQNSRRIMRKAAADPLQVRNFSQLSRRHFSKSPLHTQQQQQQSSKPANSNPHPPNSGSDLNPSLNLEELWGGASRTTKVIFIVALCICGTAETIFWIKVGWHKFFGGKTEVEQGSEGVGDKVDGRS